MKATVKVFNQKTGFRDYQTQVTVYDGAGETLYTHCDQFKNTNEVYPVYKTLAKCINHLPRFGIKHIDVKTNCVAVVKELNGLHNENTKLLRIIKDRLSKTGVTIDLVTLASWHASLATASTSWRSTTTAGGW